MIFDHFLLSRLQFAFTVAFHIVFPAFSIGLASYLAVLEALQLRSVPAGACSVLPVCALRPESLGRLSST